MLNGYTVKEEAKATQRLLERKLDVEERKLQLLEK
jgi:hypothetical protein